MFDLLYGGNSGLNKRAELHLEEIDAILGAGNREAMAQAYEHICLHLRDILQGTTIIADTGNGIPQSPGVFNVSHTEAAAVKQLFWDLANSIRQGRTTVTTSPVIDTAKYEKLLARATEIA